MICIKTVCTVTLGSKSRLVLDAPQVEESSPRLCLVGERAPTWARVSVCQRARVYCMLQNSYLFTVAGIRTCANSPLGDRGGGRAFVCVRAMCAGVYMHQGTSGRRVLTVCSVGGRGSKAVSARLSGALAMRLV